MLLKLKETIRCGGQRHTPPAVIDTEKVGISDKEANWLIRRGTAVLVDEAPEAPADDAPEVIDLSFTAADQPEPGAEVPPTEGTLAGVVTEGGEIKPLEDMTKDELLAIAKDLEIEGRSNMTKAELLAAIQAVKLEVPPADDAPATQGNPQE